jgi:hypothetical protein
MPLEAFVIPDIGASVLAPGVQRIDLEGVEITLFLKPSPSDKGRISFIVLEAIEAPCEGDEADGLLRDRAAARWRTAADGVACYDGIRHVHEGEEGYSFYPSPAAWALIWQALREAEALHCGHAKA